VTTFPETTEITSAGCLSGCASLSSNYYGVPRSSQDADLVVDFGSHSIADIARALGQGSRLDPQLSFETVTGTVRHVRHIDEIPFQIELFRLSDDAHDRERFRRRVRAALPGSETYVPTAEDVIIMKLRWVVHGRRTKDIDDIRDVIAVQSNRIDWEYVHNWCDQHGTRVKLDEIRQSIPPL